VREGERRTNRQVSGERGLYASAQREGSVRMAYKREKKEEEATTD